MLTTVSHEDRPDDTMRVHTATFFVSAGRSGTQWLAAVLGRHYSDLAEIRHEPIDHMYCPRAAMRAGSDLDDHPAGPAVRSHLAEINGLLAERDYVETGWPAFAAVPLLYNAFERQLRIVHLTRHPVRSACSMVTHRYYQPELRDDGYTTYAILQPSDPGILHKEYMSRWDQMSAYEKCLFHWAEIHAYGLEMREVYGDRIDWFQVQMEELVDPRTGALEQLLAFLDLPVRDEVIQATESRVDQHRTKTDLPIEWTQISNHPIIVDLAATLGYDAEAVSSHDISARYRRPVA